MDISEHDRIEEDHRRTQERLRGIIDTVDGIVWEVDVATFRFTFVSEQAVRLLGYALEDWYKPGFWTSILHDEDRTWAVDFCVGRVQECAAHDFEYRVLARDGRVVWLRDIVSVITSEGRPVMLRGIMVDITAGKRVQAEVQRLLESERAAREVAERERERSSFLAHEAEDAIRLRDEFLSVASHELRTPLTALKIAVQGLTSGLVSPSTEAILRSFKVVERQTQRLTHLVDALLEVTRIQLGTLTLDPEEVDLSALAANVIRQLGPEIARAGSEVSLNENGPVPGVWDRARLERVVCNLLSNAVKFGSGKPIAITVTREAAKARLVVQDHGIGIAPERLFNIFDRFERAVSARDYGGLGLGLYIVRMIVEAAGGTVRVESEVGAGSTFTVELPCDVDNGGPSCSERGMDI